jgi:hypothetical protein
MYRAKPCSAVALLMLTAACSDETEDDGFRIVELEYDGDATITLTFSQPLAELGEVDPKDFRISAGLTQAFSYGGMTYAITNYRELWTDSYPPMDPYGFVSLTAGPESNQIVLQAAEDLSEGICEWLSFVDEYEQNDAMDPQLSFDGAMFLHYARGEIPIASTEGELLADISPDWVHTPGWVLEREGYGFTEMNQQLRIPCM